MFMCMHCGPANHSTADCPQERAMPDRCSATSLIGRVSVRCQKDADHRSYHYAESEGDTLEWPNPAGEAAVAVRQLRPLMHSRSGREWLADRLLRPVGYDLVQIDAPGDPRARTGKDPS